MCVCVCVSRHVCTYTLLLLVHLLRVSHLLPHNDRNVRPEGESNASASVRVKLWSVKMNTRR